MAKVRVTIPETLEKFEFDAGRAKIKRALKGVEGRKIFSKKKTAISRYYVPNSTFERIKEHPSCWLYSNGNSIWIVAARPEYRRILNKECIIIPDLKEHTYFDFLGFDTFIPENKIVACSDVIKYGEGIYG